MHSNLHSEENSIFEVLLQAVLLHSSITDGDERGGYPTATQCDQIGQLS